MTIINEFSFVHMMRSTGTQAQNSWLLLLLMGIVTLSGFWTLVSLGSQDQKISLNPDLSYVWLLSFLVDQLLIFG